MAGASSSAAGSRRQVRESRMPVKVSNVQSADGSPVLRITLTRIEAASLRDGVSGLLETTADRPTFLLAERSDGPYLSVLIEDYVDHPTESRRDS